MNEYLYLIAITANILFFYDIYQKKENIVFWFLSLLGIGIQVLLFYTTALVEKVVYLELLFLTFILIYNSKTNTSSITAYLLSFLHFFFGLFFILFNTSSAFGGGSFELMFPVLLSWILISFLFMIKTSFATPILMILSFTYLQIPLFEIISDFSLLNHVTSEKVINVFFIISLAVFFIWGMVVLYIKNALALVFNLFSGTLSFYFIFAVIKSETLSLLLQKIVFGFFTFTILAVLDVFLQKRADISHEKKREYFPENGFWLLLLVVNCCGLPVNIDFFLGLKILSYNLDHIELYISQIFFLFIIPIIFFGRFSSMRKNWGEYADILISFSRTKKTIIALSLCLINAIPMLINITIK